MGYWKWASVMGMQSELKKRKRKEEKKREQFVNIQMESPLLNLYFLIYTMSLVLINYCI